jgi:hypothetical protein
MAEVEQHREISINIPPNQPHPSPIAANVCLVNHTGQTFVLDFGFVDPLIIMNTPTEEQVIIPAAHVGRVVIAQDIAVKLRDQLIRILGAP